MSQEIFIEEATLTDSEKNMIDIQKAMILSRGTFRNLTLEMQPQFAGETNSMLEKITNHLIKLYEVDEQTAKNLGKFVKETSSSTVELDDTHAQKVDGKILQSGAHYSM
jgi:hypothetical protein